MNVCMFLSMNMYTQRIGHPKKKLSTSPQVQPQTSTDAPKLDPKYLPQEANLPGTAMTAVGAPAAGPFHLPSPSSSSHLPSAITPGLLRLPAAARRGRGGSGVPIVEQAPLLSAYFPNT